MLRLNATGGLWGTNEGANSRPPLSPPTPLPYSSPPPPPPHSLFPHRISCVLSLFLVFLALFLVLVLLLVVIFFALFLNFFLVLLLYLSPSSSYSFKSLATRPSHYKSLYPRHTSHHVVNRECEHASKGHIVLSLLVIL